MMNLSGPAKADKVLSKNENISKQMKSVIIFLLFFSPFIYHNHIDLVEWVTLTEYDFGEIPLKQPVTYQFKYKNISDEPVTIDMVKAACGCTDPDWSDEPLLPDSVGTITVTYNAPKPGYFYKKVKIYFSGQEKASRLYLEGIVQE